MSLSLAQVERLLGMKIDAAPESFGAAWLRVMSQVPSNGDSPGKEALLACKIAADPFYRETFRHYGSLSALVEAGFLDDGLTPGLLEDLADPRFLATPLSKVRRGLEKLKQKPAARARRPVVLFTTGGFAPVHEGHIGMMEAARRRLEAEGYDVIGGFLAPAHDRYVSGKSNNAAAFPAHTRLDFLSKALAGSDWLACDPWMALFTPADLNFTDVLRRLEKYLATHLAPLEKIEVAYVFGADNAGFARVFLKEGLCVCVERPGFEAALARIAEDPVLKAAGRVFIAPCNADISSRQIRMGERLPMDCFGQPVVFTPAAGAESHFYCVRDDLDWATEPWKKALAAASPESWQAAQNGFLSGLTAAIENSFQRSALATVPEQVRVIRVPAAEQKRWLDEKLKETPFINMDCVTSEAGHPVHFSRLFFLSDAQLFSTRLVPRPGAPCPADFFSALPGGHYLLVDDDIATGFSMQKLEEALPAEIRITKRVSLLENWFREKFPGVPYEPWDILDARDFLIGSHGGGLAVEGFDGDLYRVPWLPPYVSLPNRAKIPADREKDIAVEIFRLNRDFFKATGDGLLLAHADPSFGKLMQRSGFSAAMTMSSLCDWHIDKLQKSL